MQNSKVFWILLMGSALGLYLLSFGFWVFSSDTTRWVGAGVAFLILIVHICELKTALRIGRNKALSDNHIRLMTLVFGFTWWLPLKLGIFIKSVKGLRNK